MSTTQSDRLCPNRTTVIGRRIAALLARDEVRHRPPVSLPGKPASSASSPKPKPPPAAPTGYGPQHLDLRSSRLTAEQPTPEDAFGPYTRAQLLRMNWRFVERIEQAFRNSTETREAAGASYQCEKFSDLPLNRIASPLW